MTSSEAVEAVVTGHMKMSSAAVLLGVDAASVSRLYMRGSLRGVCIDGVRFISVDSLKEYIATRVTAAA